MKPHTAIAIFILTLLTITHLAFAKTTPPKGSDADKSNCVYWGKKPGPGGVFRFLECNNAKPAPGTKKGRYFGAGGGDCGESPDNDNLCQGEHVFPLGPSE